MFVCFLVAINFSFQSSDEVDSDSFCQVICCFCRICLWNSLLLHTIFIDITLCLFLNMVYDYIKTISYKFKKAEYWKCSKKYGDDGTDLNKEPEILTFHGSLFKDNFDSVCWWLVWCTCELGIIGLKRALSPQSTLLVKEIL